jgi:uncharacterized protein YceK
MHPIAVPQVNSPIADWAWHAFCSTNQIRTGGETMHILKRIAVVVFVAFLATASLSVAVDQAALAQSGSSAHDGFNDEYLFATTKSVNRMDTVNPALKLTLYPVTIVLDTVFLPFAVVAGYVS